jgi:non-ribosomal peptide synthetase component F
MNERDCVLQKTEFSFDVSVWEFFAPLIVGARLVVARPGGHQDPEYLVDSIIRHQVTNLQLVPSLLRMLLETPEFKNCRSLRHVFCGGEAMTEDVPRLFFGTLNADLHNMYGPTEAAIDSIYYSVPRNHLARSFLSVGRWPTPKPTCSTVIANPCP